jgi:predicted aldo/keto reductase-like oxidoreductase
LGSQHSANCSTRMLANSQIRSAKDADTRGRASEVREPANCEHRPSMEMTRRMFMGVAVGAFCMASVDQNSWASSNSKSSEMQYRTLGRTGEKVSIVGIGGAHLGRTKDEQEAIRIVRSALDNGVNFLDNSWDYNGGASEERMGKALRDGYRQKAFLMTKIDGRDKKSAQQQLDQSLKRLQTDHLDLLQFHEIIRMDDPDRIFASGGALETAVAAQKAGKVRYIGFTGHKSPDIHLHMLQVAKAHGFQFDTVQMPLNVMDAHFNSFEKKVLPELVKQNIGVLGMKSMGDQIILHSKTVQPVECLRYAMNLPTSVVITGCDSMEILQQALDTARNFKPMSKEQVMALLAKTSSVATKGDFEKYKTGSQFDSTAQHPEWLSAA